MNTARIHRGESTDQGTFGLLEFGGRTVRSLELPWRDNLRKRSCIPVGRYRCSLVRSPRFGRVYLVNDVPGRSAVLLHPANFAGDVSLGWTSHLEGCIAPCLTVGVMRNAAGAMQRAGLVSRPAVTELMAWAGGQPFELEIST